MNQTSLLKKKAQTYFQLHVKMSIKRGKNTCYDYYRIKTIFGPKEDNRESTNAFVTYALAVTQPTKEKDQI